MDNQEIQNEEIEINLAEMFQVLKEHLHIIIISTLICAILVGAFTIFFVSKKYESTARIFPKPEVNEGIVDYSQISSNNSMTKNYVALLGGNNIQSKVAKELKIVDTTVDVFTNEVKETLNINNITTVDDAKLQTSPISPSVPKNIVIGGLVGAILSIGIIFIRFMLDNRLHTKEDVEKYLEIPNLGVIPYFED